MRTMSKQKLIKCIGIASSDGDKTVNHITSEFNKLTQKEYEQPWMGSEGDALGIVQETEIWSYWQIVFAEIRICPRK